MNAAAHRCALIDLDAQRIIAISPSAAEEYGTKAGDDMHVALTHVDDADALRHTIDLLRTGTINAFAATLKVHTGDRVVAHQVWVRAVEMDTSSYALVVPVPSPATTTELLQAVADVTAAIGSVDDAGRIRQVSADVTSLLGYRPADLIGRSPTELVHPADQNAFRDATEHTRDAQTSVSVPIRVRNAQGEWQRIAVRVIPLGSGRAFVFAAMVPVPVTVDSDLVRLLQGDRVSTIASDMFLSQSTVRNHLSVIYKKLGVHSQAEPIERLRAEH